MVASLDLPTSTIALDVSLMQLSDEQFYQLCAANPDLRIEINGDKELVIMPPAFGDTGERNFDLVVQLGIWNRQAKLGRAFDSSTGYILADGSKPSPDVSWIESFRLIGISLNQFIPIAPDFVIELRSSSDRLPPLQRKMQSYLTNGVRLGWLINPQDRQVEIYRSGKEIEIQNYPTTLDGEDVLPEFSLDLTTIW